MRPVSIAVYPLVCLVAASIAGCATERLGATPPTGVNLSGEWRFNPNLSDDPDKLTDPDTTTPQRAPGSHRGHGGGRGGGGSGMPPIGSPGGTGSNFTSTTGTSAADGAPAAGGSAPADGSYAPAAADTSTPARGDGFGFQRVALTAPGIEQAAPLPPTGTPPATSGAKMTRGMSINRLLKAPMHVSITQKESTLILKAEMPDGTHTTDEYTAGTSNTIPYGQDSTADRSVGWRGPVFVVTTSAKKAGWREDDFALDDDGRLIMTTQTKGGRLGKVEITRVYDRIRGAAAN